MHCKGLVHQSAIVTTVLENAGIPPPFAFPASTPKLITLNSAGVISENLVDPYLKRANLS